MLAGLLGIEFKAPEVATVVRWLLRVVLVFFLAWLVKGRAEPQEEEEDEDEAEASQRQRQPQARAGQRQPQYNAARQPPRRDPYAQQQQQRDLRQRRPVNSESVDFDAVINKMSKPKTMWEIKKEGTAPQIVKGSDPIESPPARSREPPKKESGQSNHDRGTSQATALLKKSMLQGHTRPVTWITWNKDGNLLFTCGKDKTVCVWSFPDGECLGEYEGHAGAVWSCSVTTDSSWLVSGGADQNVIVWEARASRELARVELPGVCRFVEWASAGSSTEWRFVTVHNKFASHPPALTVFRFNGEAIEQQLRIEGLPGASTQVRWGLRDELLASAHENGELIFWRADTGAEVSRLQAHDKPVSKVDFSTDRLLIATASWDMKVKVWDLGESGSDAKLLFEAKADRPLNAVSLGPLTRAMAIGAESQRPKTCSVIAGGGQDIRDVALTKGTSDEFDTLLFRLGADNALESDGATKGHFGPVHTLAFREDGAAMASGSEDGCVRLHVFDESILR